MKGARGVKGVKGVVMRVEGVNEDGNESGHESGFLTV